KPTKSDPNYDPGQEFTRKLESIREPRTCFARFGITIPIRGRMPLRSNRILKFAASLVQLVRLILSRHLKPPAASNSIRKCFEVVGNIVSGLAPVKPRSPTVHRV